jgi:hypothetical protein
MKRLDSIETDTVQLEVVECDCGYHMGIDATYLIQKGDFITRCPSCNRAISTSEICPEDEKKLVDYNCQECPDGDDCSLCDGYDDGS